MRSWCTTIVLTLAAFAAGFTAMFLLPAPERPASAGMQATTAPPPPSPVSVRHASLLARTAEARNRAVTLTIAEARGILEKLEQPVPEESLPWLTGVLRCWAEGEPDAALDWFRGWSKRGVPPSG